MLLLRAVTNCNHFRPGDTFNRQRVLGELTEEGDLSVFEVDDHTARRVAVLFAMGGRPSPDSVDYIILPDIWLTELGIKPVHKPCDINHPLLHKTHHELVGLDDAKRTAIADLIESQGCTRDRIPKAEVLRVAKAELDDAVGGFFAKRLVPAGSRWMVKIEAVDQNG